MEKSELAKDHTVSKPGRRNPEIIIFGVDPDITGYEIVKSLKSQNQALQNAEIFFKTMIQWKMGRNAVSILDPRSFKRIAWRQRLNVGCNMRPFSARKLPLQCYKCWKYGHTARDCCGVSCCGNCGSQDHIKQDFNGESASLNCAEVNTKNPTGKALPTGHAAGSKKCYVYLKQLDLTERRHHEN